MNPDAPRTPREELEIKITALLMGQLAPEEVAEVEAQIAANPELAELHTRLARAAELLREAWALKDAPTPAAPRQLSKERREQLLAKFRGIKPLPTAPKTLSRPYPARPVPPLPEQEPRSWRKPLILAASISALIIVPLAFFARSSSRMGEVAYGAPASSAPSSEPSLLLVAPEKSSDYLATLPEPEKSVRYAYNVEPSRPSLGSGQVLPKLVAGTSAPSASSADVISSRSGRASGLARQSERVTNVYLPSGKSDDNGAARESGVEKPAKNEVAVEFAAAESKKLADNTAALADGLAESSRWRSAADREKTTIFSDESVPREFASAARGDVTTRDGSEATVQRELQRRYTREQSEADEAKKRLYAAAPPTPAMATAPIAGIQLPTPEGLDARAFGQVPLGKALPADSMKDSEANVLPPLAGPAGAKGKDNLFGIAAISNEPAEEGRKTDANSALVAGVPSDSELKEEAADGSKRSIPEVTAQNSLQKSAEEYSKLGRYDLAQRKYEEILTKDPNNIEARKGREELYLKKQQVAEAGYSAARSQATWDATSFWERPYRQFNKSAQSDPKAGSDVSGVAKITDLQLDAAGAITPSPAQPALGMAGANSYWHFQDQAGTAGSKPAGDRASLGAYWAEGLAGQPGGAPTASEGQFFDTFDLALPSGRAKSKGEAAGEPSKGGKSTTDPTDAMLGFSPPMATGGVVHLDRLLIPPATPQSAPAPTMTPAKPGERPEGERNGAGVPPAQESFVNGFLAARKAEDYLEKGDTQKALETYRSAADTLAKIKEQWPNWQPELLEFRQKRTQESIAQLESKLEKDTKAADSKAAGAKPASGAATEPPPPPKPPEPPPVPQPEVSTKDNAFSTFSLNVSDVSFQLAGASLDKGKMPDAASVRSEEFINALDYRDPEPSGSAPLAFTSERARYPFAHNRDLLRLSLKTAAAGRVPGRPLNLVLLVDNSGSMERADRVSILKESMRVLSQQLKAEDKVSLITFSREPRLWADGVAGDKAAEATQRASEITPQGGTDLSAALDLGYKTALKHYKTGSINRVVLLTDGAANLGEVKAESLKAKVEAHRKQGVAFDCFGVGWEGYNDDLLEQLSRNGDGRYGFINTPESAAKEFAGQLAGALRVAASDVKVQVEFNPRRVTSYRQIGYAKHRLKKEQFRDNTVDAAEIGAAESGNALYTVEVNAGGSGDIGIARARFKVPGTSDYRELEWTIPYQAPAPAVEQASSSLRLAATASAFSEWLAQSPFASEVTTDRLLSLINGIPAIYGADNRPAKLEAMIRQAKSISGR